MRDDEVRVGLHCHSSLSDGTLAPENLAELLAGQGVRCAALTDHDTVEGLGPFRQVLARRGVGCIDGVEISVPSERGELHILGYGIDPGHAGLREQLAAARRRHDPGVQNLVDSLKRIGSRGGPVPRGPAPAATAIRAVHDAGGAAYLAHPLSYGLDGPALEGLVADLAAAGLDGLEAVYAPYSAEQVRQLADLAARHGLLVSAGTDFHGAALPGHPPAVAMSGAQWRAFRERLFRGPAVSGGEGGSADVAARTSPSESRAPSALQDLRRLRLGRFAARIGLPTAIALVLFILSIFAVIIPGFERALLERKKEMIRELTNSAASILAEYAADETAGRLTRAAAQTAAAARIRDLRYGREGKDYFWITDMRPVMVVHPYRPELEGTDVSGYMDRNGVRVFIEFVNAVREKEAGYVEYLWQWKDDAHRIVPKLSFIRRFAPWDWVIGTGIYLEDVQAEIAGLAGRLVWLSVGITVVLSLLLLYVAQQSLAIERRRRRAESGLRDSHERYRALVEASTEGMVLVMDGTCTYANRTFQEMLDFTEAQLALLRVAELVQPHPGEEGALRAFLDALEAGAADAAPGTVPPAGAAPISSAAPSEVLGTAPGTVASASCECLLLGRGGKRVEALLTASRLQVAGREGVILTVKDIGARWRAAAELPGADGASALWESAAVGLFRAVWGRRAWLLEGNPAARALFGLGAGTDLTQVNLFALAADPREAERLYADLAAGGAVRDRELRLACPDGTTRTAALTATLVRDEDGAPRRLEGMAVDLTERRRAERQWADRLAELETVSLSLGAPAGSLARRAAECGMEAPVREAAARMARGRRDALLVTGPSGEAVGIVTDADLRERVLAARLDPERPVGQIMTAPLVSIAEGAPLYEALLLMREQEVRHLVVRDASGRVCGVLHGPDLLQLHGRSLAVLKREIRAAGSAEELAAVRGRLPAAVRALLDGGARPRNVNRFFTAASDRVVERLVELAVRELGGPPVPFAFLALGSEGREEQTPSSDQDNAILYADPPEGLAESARRWFLALGESVCSRLDGMGVPSCRGGIMARNPAWCVPLSAWEAYFTRWIRQPEPQELLDFNIFFDLRALCGETALVERLRARNAALLADNPPFFLHLARDALERRLPAVGRAATAPPDLKEAMAPIVSFARLYALRHGVPATNTLDRLDGLMERGALNAQAHEETARAYTLFMELRLRGGAGREGRLLDPASLREGEEALLKEAVARLALLHKRIGFDFLGSAL